MKKTLIIFSRMLILYLTACTSYTPVNKNEETLQDITSEYTTNSSNIITTIDDATSIIETESSVSITDEPSVEEITGYYIYKIENKDILY